MTIPTMLLATLSALALAPLVIPLAVVADIIRGRLRLPALRVYCFLTQVALLDFGP